MRTLFTLLGAILLLIAVLAGRGASASVAGSEIFRVNAPSCNADVFAQIPNTQDLFVGRQINRTDPSNACKGNTQSLVLLQMDWATRQFRILRTILQTPATIMNGAVRITTAYDPYVAEFNGEYWIAFECLGQGLGGASTCIGPFDLRAPEMGIDLNRTSIAVEGSNASFSGGFDYSASDPKLLAFQNHLYLYWTTIKGRYPSANKHQWLTLTERGMEVVEQRGGSRLIWGRGLNGPVAAYDPAHNVEVWGVNPNDPRSNQTANMFSVMSIGNVIFATAGVGGNGISGPWQPRADEMRPGCVAPDKTKEGCFRLAIAATTSPLAEDTFNRHLAPENILPSNTTEYIRFYNQPDGHLFLMGRFFRAMPPTDLARAVPEGIDYITLPPASPIVQWLRFRSG